MKIEGTDRTNQMEMKEERRVHSGCKWNNGSGVEIDKTHTESCSVFGYVRCGWMEGWMGLVWKGRQLVRWGRALSFG